MPASNINLPKILFASLNLYFSKNEFFSVFLHEFNKKTLQLELIPPPNFFFLNLESQMLASDIIF